jgi:hypothetical protein
MKKILEKVRKKLENGWCQGHLALDEQGRDVFPWDEKAICWCLYGAIESERKNVVDVAQFIRWLINYQLIEEWNDAPSRTQEEVLSLLDIAIARIL